MTLYHDIQCYIEKLPNHKSSNEITRDIAAIDDKSKLNRLLHSLETLKNDYKLSQEREEDQLESRIGKPPEDTLYTLLGLSSAFAIFHITPSILTQSDNNFKLALASPRLTSTLVFALIACIFTARTMAWLNRKKSDRVYLDAINRLVTIDTRLALFIRYITASIGILNVEGRGELPATIYFDTPITIEEVTHYSERVAQFRTGAFMIAAIHSQSNVNLFRLLMTQVNELPIKFDKNLQTATQSLENRIGIRPRISGWNTIRNCVVLSMMMYRSLTSSPQDYIAAIDIPISFLEIVMVYYLLSNFHKHDLKIKEWEQKVTADSTFQQARAHYKEATRRQATIGDFFASRFNLLEADLEGSTAVTGPNL